MPAYIVPNLLDGKYEVIEASYHHALDISDRYSTQFSTTLTVLDDVLQVADTVLHTIEVDILNIHTSLLKRVEKAVNLFIEMTNDDINNHFLKGVEDAKRIIQVHIVPQTRVLSTLMNEEQYILDKIATSFIGEMSRFLIKYDVNKFDYEMVCRGGNFGYIMTESVHIEVQRRTELIINLTMEIEQILKQYHDFLTLTNQQLAWSYYLSNCRVSDTPKSIYLPEIQSILEGKSSLCTNEIQNISSYNNELRILLMELSKLEINQPGRRPDMERFLGLWDDMPSCISSLMTCVNHYTDMVSDISSWHENVEITHYSINSKIDVRATIELYDQLKDEIKEMKTSKREYSTGKISKLDLEDNWKHTYHLTNLKQSLQSQLFTPLKSAILSERQKIAGRYNQAVRYFFQFTQHFLEAKPTIYTDAFKASIWREPDAWLKTPDILVYTKSVSEGEALSLEAMTIYQAHLNTSGISSESQSLLDSRVGRYFRTVLSSIDHMSQRVISDIDFMVDEIDDMEGIFEVSNSIDSAFIR